MQQIKLLIVDSSLANCNMLEDFFSAQPETIVVGVATDGAQALEMIEKHLPDIVTLDIILPKMDGYEVLKKAKQMNLSKVPEFMVISALGREDFIMRAIEQGVSYYMVKPFDNDVLYRRVLEVAGGNAYQQTPAYAQMNKPHTVLPARSLDERIATVFLTIGIPAHIKGYHFLREAVKMVMENGDMINRITKELYPGIAKRWGTTSSKVERAIRHAIEVAWGRGRAENINQVFGSNIYAIENKPTNGEFIAMVADKLSLERIA